MKSIKDAHFLLFCC